MEIEINENLFYKKKIKALYGKRCSLITEEVIVPDSDVCTHHQSDSEDSDDEEMEHHRHRHPKKSFKDYIIISADSKWKSFFDIWILFLVGYSCFSSMYYVAF